MLESVHSLISTRTCLDQGDSKSLYFTVNIKRNFYLTQRDKGSSRMETKGLKWDKTKTVILGLSIDVKLSRVKMYRHMNYISFFHIIIMK